MKRYLVLLFVVTLILVSCVSTPSSTPTPTPIPTPSPQPMLSEKGLNLLVVARGPVQLKREQWLGYHPTTFGAVLEQGDMLKLDAGAEATMLCADLTAWPLPVGAPVGALGNCPPDPDPPLKRPEGIVGPTRAEIDPLIPYVISPRKTRLLSGQPALRWNAVTGVTTYTVTIRGDDGSEWVTRTTRTRMDYPVDDFPLQTGVNYVLRVQADNKRASWEENQPGLGFRLLTPKEAEPVRQAVERVQALALPSEALTFTLAHLYAGHGLVAEAVDLLEDLVQSGVQQPAVYRALGDLYWQTGLGRLAETHYGEAVELAEQVGDIEGKAIALTCLGEVYIRLGNKEQAHAHWQQALEEYRSIGDEAQVAQVQKRIDETR